jgi:7-cyano-7-deazaguanine synthase in queuosine biosynthesis
MTSLQVRTHKDQADDGADFLLDWFGPTQKDRRASTIAYRPQFLDGLAPSDIAWDLFRVAGAVYATDKVVKRSVTASAWSRELRLEVPVSDAALWDGVRVRLDRTLSFLTGDSWNITFVENTHPPVARPATAPAGMDAVSLFSGGLDSLAGVIDRFEAGEKLLLVGHHDSSFTESVQARLEGKLTKRYGANALQRRPLYLRPATKASRFQARKLELPWGVENTTRSRSFLFIAAGVAVANALGPTVSLYVPENGFIGINVPLTGSRAGSLSTRTTHPLYMAEVQSLLNELGLQHDIKNPYRLQTKGELLERSSNRSLLVDLAKDSISCSHPEARRWIGMASGNCGWCYPCLIRRASLHHIGADNSGVGAARGAYGCDALTDWKLLKSSNGRGRSLRALTLSLRRPERVEDVVLNGRIPNGETLDFFDVYARGREELRYWLKGAGPELAGRL